MGELPMAVGILNTSYGPAFCLANKAEYSEAVFRKLLEEKNLTFHGFHEIEGATLAWNLSNAELKEINFDAELEGKINSCMKRLGKSKPIDAMKVEISRHGVYFSFLRLQEYAPFAIAVFEKFQFNVLMNHIVHQIKNNCNAPVREREYEGVSWLGVQQNTLEGFIRSFIPINQYNGKVGVRLMRMGDGPDSFITIWQVVMGVTEDKMPGRLTVGNEVVHGCYIYLTINAVIRVVQPSDFIYIRV